MKSGFCVLWGRPNVGKSTLLNALLGRKHVIVSPRPQTTRHRIAGVLHSQNAAPDETESRDDLELNNESGLQEEIESDEEVKGEENSDGYQIVFLDTPGIHVPQHKLGEALVKTARSALQDIECVVFVGDATDKPHGDDFRAAELLKQQLGKQKVPVILALNKCDAVSESDLDTRRTEFQTLFDFDTKMTISAERGDKLDQLKSAIVERLPEGDPYFPPDMLGDRSPEFHIEELIREQAMLQLREEVPHSVAVNIELMEPRKNGTLFIEAFINVERDSQKRIVIGAGGSRIKEIGQTARQEIENLMGRSVYLELRVKVRDKWRDSEMWIQRLGYDER